MAKHNISGSEAEERVARWLEDNRYKIVDMNWKTRWCEIDIVAQKNKTMHFVEVKYRNSSAQGGGLDYITKQKLRQMRRAANSWAELNSWQGQYVLSAAEVSGSAFDVRFVEQI